jgi:glycerol-3-phosphate dehydrogenase
MAVSRDLGAANDTFDLAVIGAGITGVMIAREAAWRGLRTIVIDKGDFGAGTSSATTKYLHGGIRYLEQYEFGVVRESLRERRILALSAPHLVRQTRFLMPAWRWSRPPATLIGAGVGVYTALAWDRNHEAPDSLRIPGPRWLNRRRLLAAVPWLDPDDLLGGFAYHDTLNVHPERLLLAFVSSACEAGAVALNHVEAVGFLTRVRDDATVDIDGIRVRDRIGGTEFDIRTRGVINAAGPWMDVVLERLGRPAGVRVLRSRGVHILTRPLGGSAVVSDAVFARARSGRHVIVSPWMGHSFIGPTDTEDHRDPDEVDVGPSDVEEILDTVNSTLADHEPRLGLDDVEGVTVGIRPLVATEPEGEETGTYAASRRHELYDHRTAGLHGLWSIGGGKWTTARALAEDVLDTVILDSRFAVIRDRHRSPTRRLAAGGSFGWACEPEPFLAAASRRRLSVPLDSGTRRFLARLYGTEVDALFDLVEANPRLAEPVSSRPQATEIAAQVVFAVTREAACTLGDVIDRRLIMGTLGSVTEDEIRAVAQVLGEVKGWDAAMVESAVRDEIGRRNAIRDRWYQPR